MGLLLFCSWISWSVFTTLCVLDYIEKSPTQDVVIDSMFVIAWLVLNLIAHAIRSSRSGGWSSDSPSWFDDIGGGGDGGFGD